MPCLPGPSPPSRSPRNSFAFTTVPARRPASPRRSSMPSSPAWRGPQPPRQRAAGRRHRGPGHRHRAVGHRHRGTGGGHRSAGHRHRSQGSGPLRTGAGRDDEHRDRASATRHARVRSGGERDGAETRAHRLGNRGLLGRCAGMASGGRHLHPGPGVRRMIGRDSRVRQGRAAIHRKLQPRFGGAFLVCRA
jgi:hypothetical protein